MPGRLFLVTFRTSYNLGNLRAARLHGFEEDLGLKGQQFATLLSVLYIGYTSMQVPSYVYSQAYDGINIQHYPRNMFLNHVGRPSLYLPICMVVWGMVSFLTGK